LGIIKDDSTFDGCGCSLFLNPRDEQNHRAIFLSDLSESAAINLNGKDVKLTLLDNSPDKDRPAKIGDRSWEVYKVEDWRLRVDYTVRDLCDPKDEGCEVIYYKATLTLTRKGQKKIVRTIGLCGC
jgi:hypothetical protein